jgi:hypothetical protein
MIKEIEYKFKVGEKVLVMPRKPEWTMEPPNYIDQMTHIRRGVIKSCSNYGGKPMYFFDGYNWLEEWLMADGDFLEKELFEL